VSAVEEATAPVKQAWSVGEADSVKGPNLPCMVPASSG
jgi:hypothetical protein